VDDLAAALRRTEAALSRILGTNGLPLSAYLAARKAWEDVHEALRTYEAQRKEAS
jgi:hypothetical protein